jgi:hypothetical protein
MYGIFMHHTVSVYADRTYEIIAATELVPKKTIEYTRSTVEIGMSMIITAM